MAAGALTASAQSAARTASWHPTQKWIAATVLAAGGLLATWSSSGWHWSNTLSGATITLVSQRIVAYLVSN